VLVSGAMSNFATAKTTEAEIIASLARSPAFLAPNLPLAGCLKDLRTRAFARPAPYSATAIAGIAILFSMPSA
jgi:hypothetical protein